MEMSIQGPNEKLVPEIDEIKPRFHGFTANEIDDPRSVQQRRMVAERVPFHAPAKEHETAGTIGCSFVNQTHNV